MKVVMELVIETQTGAYPTMNSDIFKGKWNQLKGNIKQQWGDLTDNDIARIEGNYDEFVGVLQERYGYNRERAEREVNDYLNRQRV
jgi:uncharacterized protein YjbJ (UPF0337 family)